MTGLIFDGGDARRVYFRFFYCLTIAAAICAIVVQVCIRYRIIYAVLYRIIIACCSVTNAKARGVFNDDPGI